MAIVNDHSGVHPGDGSWHKGAEMGGSMVTDHPFIAPPGEPYERCAVVDEAEIEPYAPDTPHAEPRA